MVLSQRNVLIVDDDRETREMLVTILSTAGFHPVAAEDGLEALHLLRVVRRRAPETPCLVLLDLSMPRLGGNEFRRAQLNDPGVAAVPVAVMSGASDLQQRATAMGAVAVLAKPINVDLLLKVVQQYCVSGGSASRPPADRLTDRRRQDGA
jgi:two-component system, chemotaxis family, chemotaxis protein CheY